MKMSIHQDDNTCMLYLAMCSSAYMYITALVYVYVCVCVFMKQLNFKSKSIVHVLVRVYFFIVICRTLVPPYRTWTTDCV